MEVQGPNPLTDYGLQKLEPANHKQPTIPPNIAKNMVVQSILQEILQTVKQMGQQKI